MVLYLCKKSNLKQNKNGKSVSNSPLPRDRELESRTHTDRASIDVGVVKSRLRNVGDMSGELCVCKLTAESSVIVTTVRVTIGYSDSFLLPKKPHYTENIRIL